jgi:hypothetical protein
MSVKKGKRDGPPRTVTQEFVHRMASWQGISDGSLSARIVGEFSAGKTRLLSAVLGEHVPPALTPVSSREVQTRLPLEVTFGEAPSLALVEYPPGRDLGAKLVEELAQFPTRQQLLDRAVDPALHRLRLSLPLPQLVLPNGDFFDERKTPKRLFLIDMPGWNAIDDQIAEEAAEVQMAGGFNLALIYVVNADRLDSAGNKQRLAEFMETLAQAEFIERARMLLVITHCGEADRGRMQALATRLATTLWEDEIGMAPEELELTVLSADFDTLDAAGLQTFRDQFWQALLAPLGAQEPGHPWVQRIRAWDEAWQLAPRIRRSHQAVEDLKRTLLNGRKDDAYMPGMNMHRLKGLGPDALVDRLQQQWRRQTQAQALEQVAASIEAVALDAEHPLGPWWAELWQPQLTVILDSVQTFFDCADQALHEVTADTADLEAHLASRLDRHYEAALAGVQGSFARLLDTVVPMTATEPAVPAEQLLATVLSLVALQLRFEASCAAQMQQIVAEAS